jgi:hypothetical protein
MALSTTKSLDYTNLGYNIIPGTPKAGWTPVKGHLVVFDSGPDVYDLAADGEAPFGHVTSVNSNNGTISIVQWVPGVQIILERSGAIAVGQAVLATATAMGTVIPRGVVKTGAPGTGRGIVVANDPRGTNTTEVLITGGAA